MTTPQKSIQSSHSMNATSSASHNLPFCGIKTKHHEPDEETFCVFHPPDDGYALARRARLAGQRKDGIEAMYLADAAAEQANLANALPTKAWDLCTKSVSSAIVGLQPEALEFGWNALRIAQDLGDNALEARALFSIGYVALETNNEAKAQNVLEQSLSCTPQSDGDYDLFWALNNLSHVRCDQVERFATEGARKLSLFRLRVLFTTAQQALEVSMRIGVAAPRCYALLNLANAYMMDQNFDRAHALIEQCAGLAREHDEKRLLAYANLDQARLCEVMGKVPEAIAWITTPEHLSGLCKTDDLKLTTREALARLYEHIGNYKAAYENLYAARELERKVFAFQTERRSNLLSAKLQMQEAHTKVEQFRLEAQNLEIRNLRLEEERENLRRNAMLDPLTGLGNRRAADATFKTLFAKAAEGHGSFQVAYIDVDRFKTVNDTFGHVVGDQVLIRLAHILRSEIRSTDEVFRFGGEEFVLILKHDLTEIGLDTCQRLKRKIMTEDWAAIAPGLVVTASFGLTQWQDDLHQADIMARADQALYVAKESGRNQVVVR